MPGVTTQYAITNWQAGFTGAYQGHGLCSAADRIRRHARRARHVRSVLAAGAEIFAPEACGQRRITRTSLPFSQAWRLPNSSRAWRIYRKARHGEKADMRHRRVRALATACVFHRGERFVGKCWRTAAYRRRIAVPCDRVRERGVPRLRERSRPRTACTRWSAPESTCASVECHAWETLVSGGYRSASDASLNLWVLGPVVFFGGLILVLKKVG